MRPKVLFLLLVYLSYLISPDPQPVIEKEFGGNFPERLSRRSNRFDCRDRRRRNSLWLIYDQPPSHVRRVGRLSLRIVKGIERVLFMVNLKFFLVGADATIVLVYVSPRHVILSTFFSFSNFPDRNPVRIC